MECDYCNGDVAIFWQNDIKMLTKHCAARILRRRTKITKLRISLDNTLNV